jgi:hypothetical protein
MNVFRASVCLFVITIPVTNVAATCALGGPKVDRIVWKGSPGKATICKCSAVPDRLRKSDVYGTVTKMRTGCLRTAGRLPTGAEICLFSKRPRPAVGLTSAVRLEPGYSVGQDGSVGIATRYVLDGAGIESRWGGEIFRTRPNYPWSPHSLLHNAYRG